MIFCLSALVCLLCCRCCCVIRRRTSDLKKRLDRLDELEANEKKRRSSRVRTTLDTTLDIESESEPEADNWGREYEPASRTASTYVQSLHADPELSDKQRFNFGTRGNDANLSAEKLFRARRALENVRSRELAAPGRKWNNNKNNNDNSMNQNYKTAPSLTGHISRGDSLFDKIVAKDIKTVSGAFPSPSVQAQAVTVDNASTSTKRRSFRSEFDFRLRTEVLSADHTSICPDVDTEAERAREDYFSHLEEQLQIDDIHN